MIISGELPPTDRRKVEQWASSRRGALEENWKRARGRRTLERIAGPDED
jgi:hypothetical protein